MFCDLCELDLPGIRLDPRTDPEYRNALLLWHLFPIAVLRLLQADWKARNSDKMSSLQRVHNNNPANVVRSADDLEMRILLLATGNNQESLP